MPSLLNTDRLVDLLCETTLHRNPWPYAYLPRLLDRSFASRVSDSLDELDLRLCENTSGDKPYRFSTMTLSQNSDALLSAELREISHFLRGPEYRRVISILTGLDLNASSLSLSLWEYRAGHDLAPHLDKPEKIVTQIFYLTKDWKEGDGGRLLVLKNGNTSAQACALAPRLGSSAILVRSTSSWHAVEAPTKTSLPRRSLTATFWHGSPITYSNRDRNPPGDD